DLDRHRQQRADLRPVLEDDEVCRVEQVPAERALVDVVGDRPLQVRGPHEARDQDDRDVVEQHPFPGEVPQPPAVGEHRQDDEPRHAELGREADDRFEPEVDAIAHPLPRLHARERPEDPHERTLAVVSASRRARMMRSMIVPTSTSSIARSATGYRLSSSPATSATRARGTRSLIMTSVHVSIVPIARSSSVSRTGSGCLWRCAVTTLWSAYVWTTFSSGPSNTSSPSRTIRIRL